MVGHMEDPSDTNYRESNLDGEGEIAPTLAVPIGGVSKWSRGGLQQV